MENYAYEQVIGSSSAPYTNSFARAHALFTNSHAITHPSEPNYLALFSGSTQGLASDACPVTYSGANLASELAAKGYRFSGYTENAPSGNPCTAAPSSSVVSKYLYWRKHVPWADFTNVAFGSVNHPYTGPGTAMTSSVNFVVPNICDDMHDCGVASGDAWLSRNIPAMLSYANAHNGLLIVTFDEGDYSSTNHIVTIAAGPMVHNGTYTQNINHYNVLRLIEDNFGLPLLGASASATPISGLISGSSTPAPSSSFVKTGSVTGASSGSLTMQFGTGCGLLHVNTNSATVYSPSTWRPATGNSVTVYGSGSCATSVTATKLVKL